MRRLGHRSPPSGTGNFFPFLLIVCLYLQQLYTFPPAVTAAVLYAPAFHVSHFATSLSATEAPLRAVQLHFSQLKEPKTQRKYDAPVVVSENQLTLFPGRFLNAPVLLYSSYFLERRDASQRRTPKATLAPTDLALLA